MRDEGGDVRAPSLAHGTSEQLLTLKQRLGRFLQVLTHLPPVKRIDTLVVKHILTTIKHIAVEWWHAAGATP
ncbi:hypothetical protein [Tateyamaria omphalii]|uniref:Uncharacterized protein n=1 Tax=Tateyamaria omphalii TaxID=299262 RepID=A0A1P8MVA6_9RHOB|nr:hypothetical protein [Tateyamaria omphalii]APX11932.1 hypothetical protein BWR18_09775 [Tateyamaria omphalii]